MCCTAHPRYLFYTMTHQAASFILITLGVTRESLVDACPISKWFAFSARTLTTSTTKYTLPHRDLNWLPSREFYLLVCAAAINNMNIFDIVWYNRNFLSWISRLKYYQNLLPCLCFWFEGTTELVVVSCYCK